MKVRILNLDYNWEVADYLTIGKTYEATKQDDGYRVIEDNGSHKWWIREEQVKVIKQRKVYLKRESDCKIPENDFACDHCHLDKYNENLDDNACEKIMEKHNFLNCNDDNTHFKLIKIEVAK